MTPLQDMAVDFLTNIEPEDYESEMTFTTFLELVQNEGNSYIENGIREVVDVHFLAFCLDFLKGRIEIAEMWEQIMTVATSQREARYTKDEPK